MLSLVAAGCDASAASWQGQVGCGLDTAYMSSFGFIDRDANVIEAPDSLLEPLMGHLRRLRRGAASTGDRLSVLHIGDSHIQADMMTGPMRTMMQSLFGNAGRGLVSPLKLARTNEPPDYSITSSVRWQSADCIKRHPSFEPGMTGMAITTPESSFDLTIRVFDKEGRTDGRFNTVRAYHSPSSTPLCVDGCGNVAGADTVTSWCSVIELGRLTDTLTLTPKGGGGVGEYWGFSLENGRGGVIYHSIGINGACFAHFSRISDNMERTSDLAPELVLISLGTNEASTSAFNEEFFYSQIESMVAPLRRVHPKAVFVLTTPAQNFRRTRRGLSPNDNIVRARDVIAGYARDKGLALWDMYKVCGADSAAVEWYKAGLMARDRIHYTEEGYRLQAMLLFEALMNAYDRSLVAERERVVASVGMESVVRRRGELLSEALGVRLTPLELPFVTFDAKVRRRPPLSRLSERLASRERGGADDDAVIDGNACTGGRKSLLYRVLMRAGKVHAGGDVAGLEHEDKAVKGEAVKSVIIRKTRHKEASDDRERVSDVAY